MISDILGFLPSIGKVIAEDSDGNLFAGNPELVAEIANDVYLQDEPWLCPRRETLLLTPSIPGRFFRCRSEALTKAFPLTPRDTDVPGA
jgi:hypothetical protein